MKARKHLSHDSLVNRLSQAFRTPPDERQQTKVDYTIHDALMAGFACMYFQDVSLLEYQRELDKIERRNNLQTLFHLTEIPSNSQIRDLIDNVESDLFRPVFTDYFFRLQRGKDLKQYELFPGLYLCAIDGTQYFYSKQIHCDHCLTATHEDGEVSYSHKVLQAAIMHPDMRQVIPLMPEEIRNTDGTDKQDCEINAFKRLIPWIRKDHPQLGLLLTGDGLFSNGPCIDLALEKRMHFIFVAKPGDHSHLMEWIDFYIEKMETFEIKDKKGRLHQYEWMNEVPINSQDKAGSVNFLRYRIVTTNPDNTVKIHYRNSWVTDLTITRENVELLVRAGRCRWKIENECFNTLKNQGYQIEHNFGHGAKNLSFNFFLMILTAFFIHQILELLDKTFQKCRKMHGSRKNLWINLRVTINTLILEGWDMLMDYMVYREKYVVTVCRAP